MRSRIGPEAPRSARQAAKSHAQSKRLKQECTAPKEGPVLLVDGAHGDFEAIESLGDGSQLEQQLGHDARRVGAAFPSVFGLKRSVFTVSQIRSGRGALA
jgi:hypothetical protein